MRKKDDAYVCEFFFRAKLVCFLYSISGGSEWDFCVNFFAEKEEEEERKNRMKASIEAFISGYPDF